MITPELQARIAEVARRDPGLSVAELRTRFGLNKDVIWRALKKHNVKLNTVVLITSRESNGVLKATIRKIKGAANEGCSPS